MQEYNWGQTKMIFMVKNDLLKGVELITGRQNRVEIQCRCSFALASVFSPMLHPPVTTTSRVENQIVFGTFNYYYYYYFMNRTSPWRELKF